LRACRGTLGGAWNAFVTESQPHHTRPFHPVVFIAIVFGIVALLMVGRNLFTPNERIAWRNDLNTAQREAGDANKLVLLYFTASWCGPCQEMRRTVWTDERVADAMQRYVPVKVDIDHNPLLAQRYQVQAIPMIAVIDERGQVVRSIEGGMDASAAVAWLGAN
jgi:protein disulfide-isomerase